MGWDLYAIKRIGDRSVLRDKNDTSKRYLRELIDIISPFDQTLETKAITEKNDRKQNKGKKSVATKTKSKIQRHLLIHMGVKPYQCKVCNQEFRQKTNMTKHAESKHGNAALADECDHLFSHKSNLKQHVISVHKHVKPFKCNECDHLFSHNTNLKQHIISVHKQERSLLCSECDYATSQNGRLKNHIISVHKKRSHLNSTSAVIRFLKIVTSRNI